MNGPQVWYVPSHPAGVTRSEHEVGLLGVEEERLVERADVIQALRADEHHRAGRPVDVALGLIAAGVDDRLAQPEARGEVSAEDRLRERPRHARLIPERRLTVAGLVDQPRDDDPDAIDQMAHRSLDEASIEPYIRIEHQERLALNSMSTSLVDGGRVASIGLEGHHGRRRQTVSDHGQRLIARIVVDHHHLMREPSQGGRKGLEARSDDTSAVVGHNDDSDPTDRRGPSALSSLRHHSGLLVSHAARSVRRGPARSRASAAGRHGCSTPASAPATYRCGRPAPPPEVV